MLKWNSSGCCSMKLVVACRGTAAHPAFASMRTPHVRLFSSATQIHSVICRCVSLQQQVCTV